MDDNNYFLEESQIDSSYQLRVKIKYLQQDKQKLQTSNNQMKQNISLLRDINKQLSKTSQPNQIIQKLTAQNHILQSSYLRISNQNKSLTCRNLMLEQIIQQAEVQQRQILRGYQSKIIELRRSIQFKQSCIQSYQQNTNSNNSPSFDVPNIPPSNISMVFFNQIDQYKNRIHQLQVSNKRLEKDIEGLLIKINDYQRKSIFMREVIQSREGFNQIRMRIKQEVIDKKNMGKDKDKIRRSNVLSEGKVPLCQQSTKNTKFNNKDHNINNAQKDSQMMKKGEKSTCISNNNNQEVSSYQGAPGNYKLLQIKEQLQKSNIQLSKMTKAYKKEHQKRKENQQKVRTLLNSNNFYKQKRQTNTDELNYYKKSTLDLLKILQKRKVKNTYSLEKTHIQSIISNIKKPKDISNINKKQHWKTLQTQLNHRLLLKSQTQLKSINQNKLRKSLSDIFTYTSLNPHIDSISINSHKNSVQRAQSQFKKKNHAKKQVQKADLHYDLDDFSRIIGMGANGDVFDDQTLIIKSKVSYADKKKHKTKSRCPDPHDLTIITDNIL